MAVPLKKTNAARTATSALSLEDIIDCSLSWASLVVWITELIYSGQMIEPPTGGPSR
jgi:hypothetical protein